MRKGEGSGRTTDDEGSDRKSGVSCGKEETSSRESMLELGISSLLITVTREESTVLGDTSGFDPASNKGDGLGGGSSRNWNAHILTYPEEVLRDHSPTTVQTW